MAPSLKALYSSTRHCEEDLTLHSNGIPRVKHCPRQIIPDGRSLVVAHYDGSLVGGASRIWDAAGAGTGAEPLGRLGATRPGGGGGRDCE